LYYLRNSQNYTAFSHDNLPVETLSKIVSTIHDSANAVSANTFWVTLRYSKIRSSVTIHVLLSSYL